MSGSGSGKDNVISLLDLKVGASECNLPEPLPLSSPDTLLNTIAAASHSLQEHLSRQKEDNFALLRQLANARERERALEDKRLRIEGELLHVTSVAKERTNTLARDNEELRKALLRNQAQWEEYSKQLHIAEQSRVSERIEKVKKEITRQAQEKITAIESRARQHLAEAHRKVASIRDTAQERIATARAEAEQRIAELGREWQKRADAAQKEIASQTARIQELDESLLRANGELAERRAEVQHLRSEIAKQSRDLRERYESALRTMKSRAEAAIEAEKSVRAREVEELSGSLSRTWIEIEQLRRDHEKKDLERETLESEIVARDRRIAELDDSFARYRKESQAELEAEQRKSHDRIAALQKETQQRIGGLEDECRALSEELRLALESNQQRLEMVQEESEKDRAKLSESFAKALMESRTREKEAEERAQALNERVAELASRQERSESEIELRSVTSELQSLRRERDAEMDKAAEERIHHAARVQDLRRELEMMRLQLKSVQETAGREVALNASLRSEVGTLRNENLNLQQTAQSLRAKLSLLQNELELVDREAAVLKGLQAGRDSASSLEQGLDGLKEMLEAEKKMAVTLRQKLVSSEH